MRVEPVEELSGFDPTGDGWSTVDETTITLRPVPVNAVDTSRYVRDTVREDDIGAVSAVTIGAVRTPSEIGVRLCWADESAETTVTDSTEFADKAAIAFPLSPGASVMTMGSTQAPINAWYWRADRPQPYDVLAEGLGHTTRREPTTSGLETEATHDGSHWRVVFRRSLHSPGGDYVDLERGVGGYAVAVWEGRNRERGPLKAFSGEFRQVRWA